ncbi:MAG: branched-chain amino acid aminotransferase [Planctomycetaceae bacterium]
MAHFNLFGSVMMVNCVKQLWADERGFIVSAELALVSTVGVLGMMAGLTEVSGNVNSELKDVGHAFGKLDQSYSFTNTQGEELAFYDIN